MCVCITSVSTVATGRDYDAENDSSKVEVGHCTLVTGILIR